ncbi:MAG: hypothetical protein ACTMH4_04735 [Sphingobacterium sp.]
MKNTIITTILLFIAVIGATVYYFANVNGEKKETIRPLTFLPEETFVIATFRNDVTIDNIFKDFEIFEAMVGTSEITKWKELKSNLVRKQQLQPYLNGSEIYISQHPAKTGISTLFTLPTTETISASEIHTLIQQVAESYTITENDTLGVKIYSLNSGVKDSIFHIAYYKQIFFGSYSNALVQNVIDPNTPKLAEEAIDYFVENNSRNSPLSVYFAHDQLSGIAKTFMRSKPANFLSLFEKLGGHSAWNLSFKNDALILSGESETSHKKDNYLEIFSAQNKTTQRLFNYFPENTSSFLSFAISNQQKFDSDLKNLFTLRSEYSKMDDQFAAISKNKNMNWEKEIRPIFSNEFALIEQSNRTTLAFITLADTTKSNILKEKLSTRVADSIYRFDNSNIPYMVFGDPLKSFSRPYFICLENTLIISNHLSLLRTYQKDMKTDQRLINTVGFKNFEKTQGNDANITYFLRTEKSGNVLYRLLKPSFYKVFRDKANYGYNDFYSWSMQISGNNGEFTSNIYGIYKSENALGVTPEWTYQFANSPITQPWVFEHSDTSQFILIQEQDHTLHGIYPNGAKLWSAVLQGRIVGQVQQLEDRSIVFVTDRNRLYRINTEGKTLPGFSTELSYEPSNSPTVATVNDERLIFIPTNDKFLVYDMDGEQKNEWENNAVHGNILFDIKVSDNHVYMGTDSGNFYQYDATGDLLKEEQVTGTGFSNPIATGENLEKQWGVFAIDTASTLYFIDFKNEPRAAKIGNWSSRATHFFKPQSDNNKLQLYSIDNKQLFSQGLLDTTITYAYNFTQKIEDRPQFFPNESDNYMLGIASRGNAMIYLFDPKGNLYDGFPITALSDFYYGKIDYNSGVYLLCVRRDKKLYAFKK